MSRRTAESSKAIRQAWQKEQERVLAGQGTRDWTQEQQQDIIEKGKAYDADGRAFEGQHMKSAEKYPEYQGDPDNIQFLTKKEHLEAHRGNWQNPTNWYYDPVTYEFTDFGDGKFIPCTVIDLSNPIIIVNVDVNKTEPAETKPPKETTPDEKRTSTTSSKKSEEKSEHDEPVSPKKNSKKASTPNTTTTKQSKPERKTGILSRAKGVLGKARSAIVSGGKKAGGAIASGVKSTVKWGVEHKELIGAGITLIGTAATAIAEATKNGSGAADHTERRTGYTSPSAPSGGSTGSSNYNSNPQPQCDIPDESSTRTSPREHEVSEHSQRYHTKDGVVWREKKSYPRGGNKSSDD